MCRSISICCSATRLMAMQKRLPTARNARKVAPVFAIRRSRYGINKKFSIPPKKARGETLSFFDKDRSERIAHSQPRQSSAAGRKKLSPYAPSPTKSAIVFHLDCSEAPELSRSNRKGLLAPIFYFFPLA